MKKVVILSGNVAVGKSSALEKAVKNFENVTIFNEPLEQWKEFHGSKPLSLYYADRKKYAFSFQSFVIFTWLKGFLEKIKTVPEGGVLVTERSFADALNVFTRMAFDEGLISQFEFLTLKEMSELVFSLLPPDLSFSLIHLESDADLCYQRMKKRGRPEETAVTEEYLDKLSDYYFDWIEDMACSPLKMRCISIVNGNQKKRKVVEDLTDMLKFHLALKE